MPTLQDTDRWLDTVFHAQDRETLKEMYDRWAGSYDADLMLTGYLHLPVIVGLVCRHVKRCEAAILDAGAGTGMAGALLNLLGFSNLTGLDMSDGMLAKARERKCYADLRKGVLGEPLDFADGSFDAVISTGTFTRGHAPANGLDELVRTLEKGGLLMFTVGSVVWEEQGFKAKVDSLLASGTLTHVETTPEYSPMPFSPAEGHMTTLARIYRRIS